MHQFNSSILREYDIRGIVGDTLNLADAYYLGKAYGTLILRNGGKNVCLGYDGRLSSPDLEAEVTKGLLSTGIEVLRIGLGPSPMLYYAVFELDADGGIMITGSHNPSDYNGFKLMMGKAGFYGEDIQKLGALSVAGDFECGDGTSKQIDITGRYVNRLLEDVDKKEWENANLSVVWDPGNGATGDIIKELIKRLPGEHHLINGDVDGTFPVHHPDPTVAKNLKQAQALIQEKKLDIGVAFDGDGDRIGALDGQGGIIWGDQLLAIFAEEVLLDQPGANIVADVKCSQMLFDRIAELGGNAIMWKTGHSLIKGKMVEMDAPLAGEMSAHIFFKHKYYGFDDAIYAAIRLINIAARTKGGLTTIKNKLPKVINTPEIRIDTNGQSPFNLVDKILDHLNSHEIPYNDIDGARVVTDKGWWLIRASNTQDVVVLRAEAEDERALNEIKEYLNGLIKTFGLRLPDDL